MISQINKRLKILLHLKILMAVSLVLVVRES